MSTTPTMAGTSCIPSLPCSPPHDFRGWQSLQAVRLSIAVAGDSVGNPLFAHFASRMLLRDARFASRMVLRDRTEQADFFRPPFPHRHSERSRPTFSSAFAPAIDDSDPVGKASACGCEESLFPLQRTRNASGRLVIKKKKHQGRTGF